MTLPDLTGKVVALTSGAAGLGPALARDIEQAGAEVVNVGDPATAEECDAMVADVCKRFGSLDVLVNGLPPPAGGGRAETREGRDWDDLAAGLTRTYHCCQAAGRHMLDRGGGVVVNLSLALGLHPVQGFAAESVVAGAVIALTQALGVEWAPRGVRVVGVAIGALGAVPGVFGDVAQRTPLQRRGDARELSDAVVYLASDQASFVTAEILRVDGGWSAYQMW